MKTVLYNRLSVVLFIVVACLVYGCSGSTASKDVPDTDLDKNHETIQHKKSSHNSTTGYINGHEYVDLGLPSGTKWATCNVGAGTPSDYGDYYAWGEVKTKNSYTNDNCITFGKQIGVIACNPTYDVACKEWGGSWRMPTKAEFQELLDENNCSQKWTVQNGQNGFMVTSKKTGNSIFIPAAGYRFGTSLYDQGAYSGIWSATPDDYSINDAWGVSFNKGYDGDIDCGFRSYARNVRPVSD